MSDDERIAATIALNLIEMKAEGAFYNRNGNFRVRIDPPDKVTDYTHIHILDENKNP